MISPRSQMVLFSLMLMMSCQNKPIESSSTDQIALTHKSAIQSLSNSPHIEVFKNKDGTWGYDVFVDGKQYIHQKFIPAMAGSKGFEYKSQALATGELVIQKIRNGTVPPSLGRGEIEQILKQPNVHDQK